MGKSEAWLEQNFNDTTNSSDELHLNKDEKYSTRILVIDDDDNMRLSLKELLKAHDHQCLLSPSGEQGLDILAKQKIDVVLLDLNMPGMDGHEVLSRIREISKDIDVIVVSGETTFDNATRVMREGALDFLRKPYNPSELFSVLDRVLYKRKLRHQIDAVQQQLKASENRYRFIVSNSPDLIYMLDHQGVFTFINDRVIEILGFHPSDIIGKHYSEFIYEEDLEIAKYIFDERRTGPRSSHNVEFRLVCKEPLLPTRTFESHTITIELNSMGIYDQRAIENKTLVGTYGVARDITDRKRAEETIHFQAYHDLLTELPNRALFCDRLKIAISQAKRHDKKLAVMFLDMDRFKLVNDSLGHLVGDKLLQQVAMRLRKHLRGSDTLARIGGDEFNLLIPEITGTEEVKLIAGNITQACKAPFIVDNNEITVSFSIGISIFPEDGVSVETLIKHADMAMYHIKGRGKNDFEFFDNNMKDVYQHRLALEQGVRKALEYGEFQAYYQPQVNVDSGKIIGVEALIRWEHPEKGIMLPSEFIPIAEETKLIIDIGKFMLNTGCKQIRSWIDQGIGPIKISVNVSAYQLAEPGFHQYVSELIAYYDIPGKYLVLEITETALLHDMEHVIHQLKRLSHCGVGIAVDDFGVGYSSLSYLQSLPIQTLKIDRSFLSGIGKESRDTLIINAIVAMSEALGLDVVVEGVENITQLDYIRSINCTVVQGFLLGRPMPANEIEGLFDTVISPLA